MSLVYLDNETDPWISEQEACEKFYREIVEQLNTRNSLAKSTDAYASQSAAIRLRLKQFSSEVDQLKIKLDQSYTLTFEENERRQRLIENLKSKYVLLQQRFNDRNVKLETDKRELFGEGLAAWASEDEDSRTPLLKEREMTVEELRLEKQKMLAEQDRGLENLSQVISRQRDIVVTIGNEVDLQNDLVDEIADRMDRTTANIQTETAHVRIVSNKDSTWGYWIVILILFVAIIIVVLV